tara:strand:- start:819 stop:2378 length:1560 start_codon:yes stop_codon:yes gene_type:complete
MKIITRIPLALLALACLQANAAATTTTPPEGVTAAGTNYSTLATDTFIDLGEVMQPYTMADMLMCIVTASGAPLLPNETYLATADFGLCGAGGNEQAVYSGMTVKSSRASDSAPQNVNIWIDYKLRASTPIMDIDFKAQLTSAPTATNHLGVWQIDWEFQNPDGENNIENGHMKSVNGATGNSEFTMASHSAQPGDVPNDIYSKIVMTSLTDGYGRVTSSEAPDDFALAFNNSFVTIKEASDTDASCHNIESLTDTIWEYNLYDSVGALVDINTQIEFITESGGRGVLGSYSYWDGSSNQIQYWVWLNKSSDYPAVDTDTFTVSDADNQATKYTLTWDVTGSGASAGHNLTAVADGLVAGATFAHTFDNPIYFDTSTSQLASTVSPLTDRNESTDVITRSDFRGDTLTYSGAGRLTGIVFDETQQTYAVALADGTALRSKSTGNDDAHTDKIYYVKAAIVARVPANAGLSQCSSLDGPLAIAGTLSLPTAADITNNPPVMGTEPTITASPRIIDGALVD